MQNHSKNLNSAQLQMLRNSKYAQATMENIGVAWYKFNIYFRMFIPIITIGGEILNISTEDLFTFLFVLLYDGGLIVWTLFTRHWLVHFQRKGVINYFVIQFGLPFMHLLFSLFAWFVGDGEYFVTSMSRVIVCTIIFVPELIYWKKRIHLFDKAIKNKTFNQPYEQMNIGDGISRVNFCRKCGEQLTEDSRFCTRCGTEIIQIIKEKKESGIKKFPICIFDISTRTLHNEMRDIDTTKFPPSQFSDNNIYYAVETFRDGKKVRIYCTKDNWHKQIDRGMSEPHI